MSIGIKRNILEKVVPVLSYVIHPIVSCLFCIISYTLLQDGQFLLGLINIIFLWFWCCYVAIFGVHPGSQEIPSIVVQSSDDGIRTLNCRKENVDSHVTKENLSFIIGDVRRPENNESQMEWLNEAIDKIWKNLIHAFQDYIMHILWPKLRQIIKRTSVVFDMELYAFALGMVPPKFEYIRVEDSNDNDLVVDFKIVWASEASMDVQIRTGVTPVYLKIDSILIHLKVRLVVLGLMSTFPMIKGFHACLLESPIIKWRAGGIGQFANTKLVVKQIKKMIDKQLKPFVYPSKLVVPVFCLPLPQNRIESLGMVS